MNDQISKPTRHRSFEARKHYGKPNKLDVENIATPTKHSNPKMIDRYSASGKG